MEMLEEYGYICREKIHGANGNNKSGIMVFVNPKIWTINIIDIFGIQEFPIVLKMLIVYEIKNAKSYGFHKF